jgi:hypothetical protein
LVFRALGDCIWVGDGRLGWAYVSDFGVGIWVHVMDTSIFGMGCMSTRYCDVVLQVHFLIQDLNYVLHLSLPFPKVLFENR